MEMVASADGLWTCGDPWHYVACLTVQQQPSQDSFDVTKMDAPWSSRSKGKCPVEQEGEKWSPRQPAKRPKKGVCRLHNNAPNGCPYGKECTFLHKCSGCGAVDDHGQSACPSTSAPSPLSGRKEGYSGPAPTKTSTIVEPGVYRKGMLRGCLVSRNTAPPPA